MAIETYRRFDVDDDDGDDDERMMYEYFFANMNRSVG